MSNSRIERKRKSRYRKIIRTILAFVFITLLFTGSVVAYFAVKVQNVTSSSPELERGVKSELREEVVNPRQDNFSVLFLGVDDRDGNLQGRTDAMILATFNATDRTVKMISIPRDSLVEIPGRPNKDKINHAHAFGGLDLAIDTVEHLFGIPVDYYVKLNFTAFVEIVDALGGVEVEVPFTFSEMNSQDQHNAITLHEGLQTLNGEEALAFARMRLKDPTGDIGRGERQQEIIKAVIKKAATISSIASYNDIFESLEDHLETNIGFTNILSLHSYASSLKNIESLKLEGESTTINGIYYYDLTEESVNDVSHQLKLHLGLEEEEQNDKPEAFQ